MIPKDMEGLNCSFSMCWLLPCNEGTRQPKKVILHHSAKYEAHLGSGNNTFAIQNGLPKICFS